MIELTPLQFFVALTLFLVKGLVYGYIFWGTKAVE
jgi:hypothetical protein